MVLDSKTNEQLAKDRSNVRNELGRCIYDLDECRAAHYLTEITRGEIEAGVDPIGFLIASHAALSEDNKCLRRELRTLLLNRGRGMN